MRTRTTAACDDGCQPYSGCSWAAVALDSWWLCQMAATASCTCRICWWDIASAPVAVLDVCFAAGSGFSWSPNSPTHLWMMLRCCHRLVEVPAFWDPCTWVADLWSCVASDGFVVGVAWCARIAVAFCCCCCRRRSDAFRTPAAVAMWAVAAARWCQTHDAVQ